MTLLGELARLGAAPLSVSEWAMQSLRATLRAVGADGGDLCVLAGSERHPLASAWPDLDEEETLPTGARRDERIEKLFADKTPRVWPTNDDAPEPLKTLGKRLGFRTLASVPLYAAGRPVGLLDVAARAADAFGAPALETLAEAAALLGPPLDLAVGVSAAAGSELGQNLLELRTLQRSAETLSRSLDLDQVLSRCLDMAIEVAHASAGAIYLRDDRELIYRRCFSRSLPLDVAPETMPADRLEAFLKTAPAPLVRDLELPSEFALEKALHDLGFRRALIVPLQVEDRPVGLLALQFFDPMSFADSTVATLQAIADHEALAIENARVHRAVDQQRAMFGSIVENLPVVIAVINDRGQVEHLNAAGRAFAEEFGTVGMDWRDSLALIKTQSVDGRPVPREELLISRCFRGEHPAPRELVLLAADGTRRRAVLSVAAPLSTENGRVTRVVTGFSDVSALRELADAKDRFLRIASHELRSPITSLRATTSLLEIDPSAITDPERRNTMLQRIQRQIDRLVKLVEQLIDSARLGKGEVPIEQVDCDLVAIARESIELARSSAKQRTVTLEAPASLPGRWDPLRIEQVISNLVANALRYSAAGTAVEVRISDGDRVRIEVRDTGIGIPPEQLGQVFSPFFRASNAQHQHKGGLGLGLYIAAESVRRHGGTIQVESRLGQGTTFTVELPR